VSANYEFDYQTTFNNVDMILKATEYQLHREFTAQERKEKIDDILSREIVTE